MQGTATLLAGAATAALGLSFWSFDPPPALPPLVQLDPAPFAHRLDGDWQHKGRPIDAPVATVSIPAPVQIMAMSVSVSDWMACVTARACALPAGPTDRADLPVTGVSWIDANGYARWMSDRTGDTWRLPSDVEWAHAAAELFRDDALGVDSDPSNPALRWLAEYRADAARKRNLDPEIRPVGRLNVNSLGVHDVGGAVWEWTATCLRRVEVDATGTILRESDSCGIYIAEGLHRAAIMDFVRDPKSGGCSVGVPPANLGFRLVREAG